MSAYSKESRAERLLQLSNEVSRIAGTLARLSSEPAPIAQIAGAPEISPDAVMSVIRARRLRTSFFDEQLFADPAWDMMLDLFHAELTHQRVAISSLCAAAAVPATTALRWLKTMVDEGLFVRRADPHDGRRIFVELTADTSNALRRYFSEIRNAVTV